MAILALLLFVSLFAHLTSLLGSLIPSAGGSHYHAARTPLEEVVIEDNDSRDKILVLPIEGLIMDAGFGGGHAPN